MNEPNISPSWVPLGSQTCACRPATLTIVGGNLCKSRAICLWKPKPLPAPTQMNMRFGSHFVRTFAALTFISELNLWTDRIFSWKRFRAKTWSNNVTFDPNNLHRDPANMANIFKLFGICEQLSRGSSVAFAVLGDVRSWLERNACNISIQTVCWTNFFGQWKIIHVGP